MRYFPLAVVALVVLVATLVTQPQTMWQGEELRFAQSLLTFDPMLQQPERPGYPLYVAIGRLLNFFLSRPFTTLLVLSVVATVAGAVLTGLAAMRLLDDEWLGAAAAMFLYGSPAMLIFSPLPNEHAMAVAFIAAAILWGGAFAACAIGVMPLAAAAAVFGLRRSAAAFWIALAVVFVPFAAMMPRAYLHAAEPAADVHGLQLVYRYLAHQWGPKYLSFPLLALAAIGIFLLGRRRQAAALLVFAVLYLATVFAFANHAEGVEPAIPALIAIAIFAAAAFVRWPRIAFAVAAAYAIASFVYAWPLLHLRHTTPSPPARAMRYVREFLPDGAVLICDPAMEPWGKLSRFDVRSFADFDAYAFRPDVPLFMLGDGSSRVPHAAQFSWPEADVFGKVTSRRYRVVSLMPFPPSLRYRSLGGVYSFERTPDGDEFRWLAGDATISLPPLADRVVHLRLALPAYAPIASNAITINGTTVNVARGQTADVAFPAAPLLRFHAAHTFRAAEGREIAVQLIGLEQR